MKCVLEHCEFANGGHCALVCPKHLERRIARKAEADKIESCIAMLRNVRDGLSRRKTDERRDLPTGVYFNRDRCIYTASISYNGKVVYLGEGKDVAEALALRADAEQAKAEGKLDEFLRKRKATRKKERKAKRKAKGRDSAL